MILSTHGGALAKMLLPFKLGAGGVVGSGRQFWSWISLDDVASAIAFCLQQESLAGPVNVVAPQQVTNRTFTKTLGRVLRRPTVLPTARVHGPPDARRNGERFAIVQCPRRAPPADRRGISVSARRARARPAILPAIVLRCCRVLGTTFSLAPRWPHGWPDSPGESGPRLDPQLCRADRGDVAHRLFRPTTGRGVPYPVGDGSRSRIATSCSRCPVP